MKKHIVIDCFKQIKGEGKSIGIYNVAREITRVLSEQHPEATITVLGNEENRSDFALPNVNFLVMKGNPHSKLACVLWELFTVSKVLKQIKADTVIFPRGYAALTHPVEDVVMIHDMIPFYYHEHYRGFFSRLENFYVMTRLKASARSAKKVLTISEASKRDIVRYTGCDEAKIHVVYNGCSKIDYDGERGGGNYFTAITSSLPHKNAQGVARAYEAYLAIAEHPLPLHLIGVDSLDGLGVSEETKRMVTCHKFIRDNATLHELIARSEGFLFLSLIEGFGLPPVEAMQMGVPVVCSGTTSLPEACGNAALLVDPTVPEEAARALLRIQTEEGLADRLRELGYKNAERFSKESRGPLYWDVIQS